MGSAAATACLGERQGGREWEIERDEVWLRKEVLKTKSEGIILAGGGWGGAAELGSWGLASRCGSRSSGERRALSAERALGVGAQDVAAFFQASRPGTSGKGAAASLWTTPSLAGSGTFSGGLFHPPPVLL